MPKTGKVEFVTRDGKKVQYSYTPLGEIMATIYPLLSKNGLSVRHEITDRGVEAILTHETFKSKTLYQIDGSRVIGVTDIGNSSKTLDGKVNILEKEYDNEIRSGVVAITKGSEMKDTGAAITYARRYTLTMVLGISSEDDKDAELLEQTVKNAIQSSYDRLKKGIEGSKTIPEIDKAMKVVQKDLELISKDKAPALGLSKEQYLDLTLLAENLKRGMTAE